MNMYLTLQRYFILELSADLYGINIQFLYKQVELFCIFCWHKMFKCIIELNLPLFQHFDFIFRCVNIL
jgi:hypothetical protein